MHVLLMIRDPQAAAAGARALRKVGMTVDVAMNARIASAMAAESSHDVVVFEEGLGSGIASSEHRASVPVPAMIEITAAEAADPDGLSARVRGVVEDR